MYIYIYDHSLRTLTMPLLPTVTLTCRLAPLKPTCRMAPRLTGRHRSVECWSRIWKLENFLEWFETHDFDILIYIYTYIIYSDSSSSSKLKLLPNGDSFADSRARAYPPYPFAACLVAAAWSLENGKRGSYTSLKTSPEVVKQQTGSQKHVFLVDFL